MENADAVTGAAFVGVPLDRYQRAADDVGDKPGMPMSTAGIDVEDHAGGDERRIGHRVRVRHDRYAGDRLSHPPGLVDARRSRRRVGDAEALCGLHEAEVDKGHAPRLPEKSWTDRVEVL